MLPATTTIAIVQHMLASPSYALPVIELVSLGCAVIAYMALSGFKYQTRVKKVDSPAFKVCPPQPVVSRTVESAADVLRQRQTIECRLLRMKMDGGNILPKIGARSGLLTPSTDCSDSESEAESEACDPTLAFGAVLGDW